MYICECKEISKRFMVKQILKNFSMQVEKEKITCISGVSGSGKTTLLNIIGCLEKVDSGSLYLFGDKVNPNLKGTRKLLRDRIGYLFQDYALLDDKTVTYNLNIAMEGHKIDNKTMKIKEALTTVGLEGFEKREVRSCSGGEQQRVAIARLLLKPCELILADEPTGSLDDKNKIEVFMLLKKLVEHGKTVIIVTHDEEIKSMCDFIIKL